MLFGVIVLSTFGLLSACYDVMLFVVLLRRFIFVGATQTSKADLISPRSQIMVVSMLKNLSHKYYSHYIIKCLDFISIYYAINKDIISSYMIFSYLCDAPKPGVR